MHFTTILFFLAINSVHAFDCQWTVDAISKFQSGFYNFTNGEWQGGIPRSVTWYWANALTVTCDFMLAEIKGNMQYLADIQDTFHKMEEGNLQGNQTALEILENMEYLADLPNTFLKIQEANLQGNQTALEILENTYPTPAVYGGFIDMYYDDNGWWALAWIRAYDLTKHQPYLDAAEQNFEEMTTGWDDVCKGGIWWNTDKKYKNAIANELFLSVAASLANRVPEKRSYYVNWATKELEWFQQSGMMNSQGTINDGLDSGDGLNSSCKNNHEPVWSYNQGVILGGLVELNKVHPNSSYITYANNLAKAAIANLTVNGILEGPCGINCGGPSSFKGIFIRNLAELNVVSPHDEYKNLILTNANSLWNNARYPNTTFGDAWAGPLDDVNVVSETAAIDLLVAAYGISHCHLELEI